MNGKKAREIRNAIKIGGKDPSQVKYVGGTAPEYMKMVMEDGKPRPATNKDHDTIMLKVKKGVPRTLDPVCGRFMYKKIKADYTSYV